MEEGDCLGVSKGDGERELAEEEGAESWTAMRRKSPLRGFTAVDMVEDRGDRSVT